MSLWRNHPTTLQQQNLPFGAKRNRRAQPTQADVLIAMLRVARVNHEPLELPDIMKAGIAQHGARLKEIRDRGFRVENEMERTIDGAVLSRYWLTFDPEVDAQ